MPVKYFVSFLLGISVYVTNLNADLASADMALYVVDEAARELLFSVSTLALATMLRTQQKSGCVR